MPALKNGCVAAAEFEVSGAAADEDGRCCFAVALYGANG
jgi:hypothetical protein